MTRRVARYDRAPLRIRVDADLPVSPTHAPATVTEEGYLVVHAWIARDGLLEYSDGVDTWMEYRPREELEKAASTWQATPVTDDHPPVLVSVDNHSEYARGVTVEVLPLETIDGVSYLPARLSIRDAELIERIKSGEQAEISIGFTSLVVPAAGVTEYRFVQTDLLGNHNAIVKRGRAGAAVRVFMDGIDVIVPTTPVKEQRMLKNKSKRADEAPEDEDKKDSEEEEREDELGAPVDEVEVIGPDGQPVMLPSWVAALVEQARGMAPVAPPAPPASMERAPAPTLPGRDSLTADAVSVLVRKRARLERLAVAAGIEETRVDSLDDLGLSRAYAVARVPEAKALVAKFDAHQLDAVVAFASSLPSKAKEAPKTEERVDALDPFAPHFGATKPVPQAPAEYSDAELRALQKAGY